MARSTPRKRRRTPDAPLDETQASAPLDVALTPLGRCATRAATAKRRRRRVEVPHHPLLHPAPSTTPVLDRHGFVVAERDELTRLLGHSEQKDGSADGDEDEDEESEREREAAWKAQLPHSAAWGRNPLRLCGLVKAGVARALRRRVWPRLVLADLPHAPQQDSACSDALREEIARVMVEDEAHEGEGWATDEAFEAMATAPSIHAEQVRTYSLLIDRSK